MPLHAQSTKILRDLAMLGYLAGPRRGAVAYHLAHPYALAVPVLAAGILTRVQPVVATGLIWCAHLSFDRALGCGLKLPEGFRATHLGRIGHEPHRCTAPRPAARLPLTS